MKLKLAKCKFGQSEIQFLGHIINHEGIRTLYHPDPNTLDHRNRWRKTAFAGMLLQPYIHNGIKQEVPVTFISYNFTSTQQAWSATE